MQIADNPTTDNLFKLSERPMRRARLTIGKTCLRNEQWCISRHLDCGAASQGQFTRPMNEDSMRYLVVVAHPRGDYLPERDLADLDRVTTVRDIRDKQWNDVINVIEFNIAEGIIRDCTEDILREAANEGPNGPF